MKAVYTDYPYKYWIDGARGEMFLFSDDEKAADFAARNSYFLINDPNAPELAYTWARLAWSFLDCGGTVRIEGNQDGCWHVLFFDGRDRSPITYEEFESVLYETYDMPCVECWTCGSETGWKSENTGLTYEEVFGE